MIYKKICNIVLLIILFYAKPLAAQSIYEQDFLEFWNDFNDNYAYFEQQGIDWNKVKEIYQPRAKTLKSTQDLIMLLEAMTYELHNGHVSLQNNLSTSNNIIPSGQDIFAEKKEGRFIITDIRKNSKAEASGLKPGMQVIKFNGMSIEGQLQSFYPKYTGSYNEAMDLYALNMLLAGTHDRQREISILENGAEKVYRPDEYSINNIMHSNIEFRILEGNIGYIKINNSLGNNELIKEFDDVLDKLLNTKSLILDLTETPSGGNTTVARGIMGRFITKELPYQKHVLDEKQYNTTRSWIEYVTPRKTVYKNKVVIMAGHWTGSMGEGIVIGFDAMKRAKITGTKMAGLIGAVYSFRTKNTNIGYQIPTERMYHVNGTPREDFIPRYLTSNTEETYNKALKLAR
ncbi:peptidase [Flavobacterium sp. Sd200]|uniref:S41 family peptidase n=1 Tax=Flavobacterium sp. Sd200 TaxID=2692211 RepID=UPI00137214A8|nr:S41 family peptidase [Flavobacterium sp. Sd200]MXN91257.1 peptidase [Flavobacterium sp. Sd200]